jgi:alkaline phosphatase D
MRSRLRVTRRDFLRAAGAAAALPWLPGCGDDIAAALGATFDVDAGGAVIAVAAPGASRARAEVIDEATGDVVATPEGALGAGGTGRLDVSGLAPDRRYIYHLTCDDGARSAAYAFTTPPADATRAVTLAFSADVDVDPMWDSPIFDAMIAAAPEVFVMLGDFPYADDAPGAVTLDEYRARHRACRADDRIQRWLQTTSVYAIYDDHEVRNNWDEGFWTSEGDRVRAGLAAWDEWFPVRGVPADTDVRTAVRYRAFSWGPLVDGFLLDCRRFRSASSDPDGPGKTMLGAIQKQWLIDGLVRSHAPFKLIFTSVPLDYGYVEEHWGVYTTERDEILRAIRDAGVEGVLFLTADQHWFASHRCGFGAREMQVGPLARGMPELPPAVDGVLVQIRTYNFGVIEVSPGTPPRLTFRARDAGGALLYEEAFAPVDLALR